MLSMELDLPWSNLGNNPMGLDEDYFVDMDNIEAAKPMELDSSDKELYNRMKNFLNGACSGEDDVMNDVEVMNWMNKCGVPNLLNS